MRGFFRTLLKGVLWSVAFTLVVAIAAGLGIGLLSLSAADEQTTAEPLPVSVISVVSQDRYVSTRRFPGRIESAQVSDIGFQVGGEVVDVLVKVGDRVAEGAVLARLDPARLEDRRNELAAARDEARAALARAEATIERISALVTEGYATPQDLDDITAERDAQRARVRQLDQALATARRNFNDAVMTAPFAGVIVQRYVDGGVTVNPGQPVVRLNASGTLEAMIGIPASFAATLKVGDTQTLTSGEMSAEGRVTGIGDTVDTATRTLTVRFEIAEDPGFVPGSLVRVSLEDERMATGMWVPSTALTESYRGLWSVYVVVDDGKDQRIARKDVQIIHIGDDRVFVSGTLEEGDRVVMSAPFRFVPGQRVVITDGKGETVASRDAT